MAKKHNLCIEKSGQERLNLSSITIIYLIALLTLLLFLCITKNNYKDHLRMLLFVGISIIPAATFLSSFWHFLKPKKKHIFLLVSSILAIPLLLLGRILISEFVNIFLDKGVKWGPNYWTIHGGLQHYINNITAALLLTCYFSIPYFLSVVIARETRIRFRKTSIICLWILWISVSYILYIAAFAAALN